MLQYLLYRHLIGSVLLFIATVIVFALAGEALSGASLNSGVSVGDVVFERLPNTLKLLPLTIFFAAVISIPLGILAAVCRGTLVDRAVGSLAVLGVATPNFWLGLVLIYLFYVLPDWRPSLGMEGPSSYILPCFVLGTFAGAGMPRVIRSGIVEVLHREEQPGWSVFWNPCFRLLAAAPILFGGFLAGAVVVETTFSWPGIGHLALQAILQADMPVLLAIILLAAAIALSFKLAVDFLVMVVEVLVRGPNPAIPQDWRRTGPPFPRIAPAPSGAWQVPWISLIILGIMVFAATLGAAIAPEPFVGSLGERLQPPSAGHLLGTDHLGQDILSRVLHGARYSLIVALLSLLPVVMWGGTLGLASGWVGGKLDALIMWAVNTALTLPLILFVLGLVVVSGPGWLITVQAVTLILAPRFARVAWDEALTLKLSGLGAATAAHWFNVLMVLLTLHIGLAILIEATLSFLGAGLPPPIPSLGSMDVNRVAAWWIFFSPAWRLQWW